MSISFSGLSSGIDTSSWVKSLTALKQAKVTKLEEQKDSLSSMQDILANIKTFFSNFRSTIERVTDAKFCIPTMDLFTQNLVNTSRPSVVTAKATHEAEEAKYKVKVSQLATKTQATSGIKFSTVVSSTVMANKNSELSSIGIGTGDVEINVNGVLHTITIEEGDKIRDLIDAFRGIGVNADFNESTGVFSINIRKSDINDTISHTGIVEALHLDDADETYYASNPLYSSGGVAYADGSTALGAVVDYSSLVGAKLEIKNSSGVTIGSLDSEIDENTDIDGLFAKLEAYGIHGSIDSDGVITLDSDDGNYITGSLAEALGIGTTGSSVTTTTGAGYTSSKPVTYTVVSSNATELTGLGEVVDFSAPDSGQMIVMSDSDTVAGTITMSGSQSIQDLFDELDAYGIEGSITDGVITLESHSGNYVAGSLASSLGIGTDTENSLPKYVAKTVSSTVGVTAYTVTGSTAVAGTDTITQSLQATMDSLEAFADDAEVVCARVESGGLVNDVTRMTQAEAVAAGYTWVTDAAGLQTALTNKEKICLGADIDMTTVNSTWTMVSGYNNEFNGNGYAIQNFSVTVDSTNAGLIASTSSGAVLKNIRMENVYVENTSTVSGSNTGGLVGSVSADSTIDNISIVSGEIINVTGNYARATGIAGINSSTITNCYNAASVSSAYYSGGIAGQSTSNASITNCYNTGSITVASFANYAGGIVGQSNSSITNCYNAGLVSGARYSGGIAGLSNSSITDCYNTGSITACTVTGCGGGIVGISGSTITNCYNAGSVSGTMCSGGIAGKNTYSISNCYNAGSVNATNDQVFAGGIAGEMTQSAITNCYNIGSITANCTSLAYAAGIVGNTSNSGSGTNSISNCYNIGSIIASGTYGAHAAGIVGSASVTSITNCVNSSSDIYQGASGTTNGYGLAGASTPTITDSYYNNALPNDGMGTSTSKADAEERIHIGINAANGYYSMYSPSALDSGTRLSELGLTSDASITLNNTVITVETSDTIQDMLDKLSPYVTGSVADSKITLNGINGNYIVSMDSSLASALNLSIGENNSYQQSATPTYANTSSTRLGSGNVYTLQAGETLANYGLSSNGYITVNQNGTSNIVTVTDSKTVETVISELSSVGVTATLSDGKLNMVGSDTSTITGVSANLLDILHMSRGVSSSSAIMCTALVGATESSYIQDLADISSLELTGGNPLLSDVTRLSETDAASLGLTWVTSADELQTALAAGRSVCLANNIDMSELTQTWVANQNYSGTIEGNGYVISNFTFTSSSTSSEAVGLVGKATDGAKFRNIAFENVYVEATGAGIKYAGALVGMASAGVTISNISVLSGTVTASTSSTDKFVYSGGIVGYSTASSSKTNVISDCYNAASVSGSASNTTTKVYTGGIAGYLYYSIVDHSYNDGSINAESTKDEAYAGGISGYGSYATMKNSFDAGAVHAQSTNNKAYAGGIAGRNSTIISCATSTTDISASGSSVKVCGVTAVLSTGGVGYVTDSYYNNSTGLTDHFDGNGANGVAANNSHLNPENMGFTLPTGNGHHLNVYDSGGNLLGGFNVDATTQLSGLFSELSAYGIMGSIDSDGVIHLTSADGNYVAGSLADALGISFENATVTITSGASVTSSGPIYYTIPSDDVTTNNYLRDVIDVDSLELTGGTKALMADFVKLSEADAVNAGMTWVTTADELQAALIAGDSICLANDIDMTELSSAWTCVQGYSATFEGNGYTINNFSLSVENASRGGNYGFIGSSAYSFTIRNLAFENVDIDINVQQPDSIGMSVGAVVGEGTGTIENVSVLSGSINVECAYISDEDFSIGGIAGYMNDTSYCYNGADINVTLQAVCYCGVEVAGIVAYGEGVVSHCYNAGSINTEMQVTNNYTSAYVGGISSRYSGYFNNCYNSGSMTVTCTDPSNYGVSVYAGGITGNADYASEISNCISNCSEISVTGASDVSIGGIACDYASNVADNFVNGCYYNNNGGISDEFDNIGAIGLPDGNNWLNPSTYGLTTPQPSTPGHHLNVYNLAGELVGGIDVDNSTKISDLFTELSSLGITGTLDSNGIMHLTSAEGNYVSGSLADALGIETVSSGNVRQPVTSSSYVFVTMSELTTVAGTESITQSLQATMDSLDACAARVESGGLMKEITQMTQAEAVAAGYTWVTDAAGLQTALSGTRKICLGADIDMTSVNSTWTMVTGYNKEFNGNGYTIRNFSITASGTVGLIGTTTSDAVLKNIRMENVYVENTLNNSDAKTGALVGYETGGYRCYISNVAVVSGTVKGGGKLGGVVGELSYNIVEFASCYNAASVIHSTTNYSGQCGGVVGYSRHEILNCYNAGNVSSESSVSDHNVVGGIVGCSNSKVLNCYNSGSISGGSGCYAISGIVGSGHNATNCCNFGDIINLNSSDLYTSRVYIGGIMGSGLDITNCYNAGNIDFESEYIRLYSGGIAGTGNDVSNCYNTGSLIGNRACQVGGIVGELDGNMDSCVNYNSDKIANALVYYKSDSMTTITNSYYVNTLKDSNGGTAVTQVEAAAIIEKGLNAVNGFGHEVAALNCDTRLSEIGLASNATITLNDAVVTVETSDTIQDLFDKLSPYIDCSLTDGKLKFYVNDSHYIVDMDSSLKSALNIDLSEENAYAEQYNTIGAATVMSAPITYKTYYTLYATETSKISDFVELATKGETGGMYEAYMPYDTITMYDPNGVKYSYLVEEDSTFQDLFDAMGSAQISATIVDNRLVISSSNGAYVTAKTEYNDEYTILEKLGISTDWSRTNNVTVGTQGTVSAPTLPTGLVNTTFTPQSTAGLIDLATVSVTSSLDAGTYKISSAQGLKNLATLTNNGRISTESTYILENDIDLSELGEDWIPIGFETVWPDRAFHGTFDGNGHKVYNITIDASTSDKSGRGLFGYCKNATIKNLETQSVTINLTDASSNSYTGAIVGNMYEGKIINCKASDVNISYSGSVQKMYTGGIVGFYNPHYYRTGTSIEDCYVQNATINVTGSDDSLYYSGGILGYTSDNRLKLLNCYVDNSSIISSYSGGLAGYIQPGRDYENITYEHNTAIAGCNVSNSTINGSKDAGGMLGTYNGDIIISNSKVYNNNIEGGSYSGGIIGCFVSSSGPNCSHLYLQNSEIDIAAGSTCNGLVIGGTSSYASFSFSGNTYSANAIQGRTNIYNQRIYTNSDSNVLASERYNLHTALESTTLGTMGITSKTNITYYDSTGFHSRAFDTTDSIGTIKSWLETAGFDVTYNDGFLTIDGSDNLYITDMDSTLGSLLKMNVGNGYSYNAHRALANTESDILGTGGVTTIQESHTLADCGLSGSGTITVIQNGTTKTVNYSETTEISTLLADLGTAGISAELVDGKFTFAGNENTFIQSMPSALATVLGIGTGFGNMYTETEYTGIVNTASNTFNRLSSTTIRENQTLADCGLSGSGTITVIQNGTAKTVNYSETTEISTLLADLRTAGISAELVDGKFTFIGNPNAYIKSMPSNLSNALKLQAGEGYTYSTITQTSYSNTNSGPLTSGAGASVLADENTKIADVEVANFGSTTGEIRVSVDGQSYNVQVDENETFGSLIGKLNGLGFTPDELTASIRNGIFKIDSLGHNLEITQVTSHVLSNLGMVYNQNEGNCVASTEKVMSSYDVESTERESAAAFADMSMKMSSFNISDGTLTIFRDGQKGLFNIDSEQTLAQLNTQINNKFSDVTLEFQHGKLVIQSSNPNSDVYVGATTDTSNFNSVLGFSTNNSSPNIAESSKQLYKANLDSKVTEAGLFKKGNVTEGTFTVGTLEITIDDSTTIANIISIINNNQEANAAAYWDSVNADLVIQFKSSGHSMINIEAGTSNFTDILGYTTSEWNDGNLVSTRINLDSQELGKNAKFTINGTTFTSTSNTITSDISKIKGLTIELNGISENEEVELSVEKDKDTISDAVSDVVDAYNELITNVEKEIAIGAALHGESMLKILKDRIRSLMMGSEPGALVFKNLSQIGISTEKASANNTSTKNISKLNFDRNLFGQAFASDNIAVKNLLVGTNDYDGIFTKVENVLENALKSVTGYFDATDRSLENKQTNLDKKITKANQAIERYRAQLEAKFNAMDILIGQMQHQYSSFLSGGTGR